MTVQRVDVNIQRRERGKEEKKLSEASLFHVLALQRERPESMEWSGTELGPVDGMLDVKPHSQRLEGGECGELQRAFERRLEVHRDIA